MPLIPPILNDKVKFTQTIFTPSKISQLKHYKNNNKLIVYNEKNIPLPLIFKQELSFIPYIQYNFPDILIYDKQYIITFKNNNFHLYPHFIPPKSYFAFYSDLISPEQVLSFELKTRASFYLTSYKKYKNHYTFTDTGFLDLLNFSPFMYHSFLTSSKLTFYNFNNLDTTGQLIFTLEFNSQNFSLSIDLNNIVNKLNTISSLFLQEGKSYNLIIHLYDFVNVPIWVNTIGLILNYTPYTPELDIETHYTEIFAFLPKGGNLTGGNLGGGNLNGGNLTDGNLNGGRI